MQICLSAVIAARTAPFFGSLLGIRGRRQRVESSTAWYEPDLLGRHRAVVELVDAVGQLGGHDRLGLRATEHEDPVERSQRRLAVAGELGDERRSRADEAGVA